MAENDSPNDKNNKKDESTTDDVAENTSETETEAVEESTDTTEDVAEETSEEVEDVTTEEAKEVAEIEKEEEAKIEDFRTGDTVRILYKIIEGQKERIQPYEGIVISRKGHGLSKTFTVRRIGADRVGVERIFPLHSPNIVKLEVKRKGKVRRAKLYYLRDKIGRAATKVKERK